jgi:RimJ/RimL family protein N-acetyltransferase
LTLEPQTAEHAPEMFAVLCDPAIYEHENQPPPSVDRVRERFLALESRCSPDGNQHWLNWVIRLSSGRLAGYVQATVYPDARAAIAYVLESTFWGRGLARRAAEAMIEELADHYGVQILSAVLKRDNVRSLRLLERLGFAAGDPLLRDALGVEADELLMLRDARTDSA